MLTAAATTDLVVTRAGRDVVDHVTLRIGAGERWVVLGPNGSGKTTLARVLAAWLRPSRGELELLGVDAMRADVRPLRSRIGFTSQAMADLVRPGIDAAGAVVSALNGALETWWHRYDDDQRARALALLDSFGAAAFADRAIATLSSGERQRVLLARAFVADPGLVVLDEPTAGLDIGGREDLVARLDRVAAGATGGVVLVTHHLEEVPPSFTHALLLRDGSILAAGPVEELLTTPTLSELFSLPLVVRRVGPRWSAFAERE